MGGVLWAGFVKNQRRFESRISAHLARFAQQRASDELISQSLNGEHAMSKILVPVDSSKNSRRAVQHIIGESRKNAGLEVHLLNVQPPFSRHIARFVAKKSRDDYHREESEKVLVPIKKLLTTRTFAAPHTAPSATRRKRSPTQRRACTAITS